MRNYLVNSWINMNRWSNLRFVYLLNIHKILIWKKILWCIDSVLFYIDELINSIHSASYFHIRFNLLFRKSIYKKIQVSKNYDAMLSANLKVKVIIQCTEDGLNFWVHDMLYMFLYKKFNLMYLFWSCLFPFLTD